jgi:hypothetical protein
MDTQQILAQLIAERDRIDAAIKLLSGSGTSTKVSKGKSRMSAAARKRIGDAQRKRWAAAKKKV